MAKISNKGQIVLAMLKKLNANDYDSRTSVYDILSMVEESDLRTVLPSEGQHEIDNIKCELSQKSASTVLAGLVRRGIVIKTSIENVPINNEIKEIVRYYLG